MSEVQAEEMFGSMVMVRHPKQKVRNNKNTPKHEINNITIIKCAFVQLSRCGSTWLFAPEEMFGSMVMVRLPKQKVPIQKITLSRGFSLVTFSNNNEESKQFSPRCCWLLRDSTTCT